MVADTKVVFETETTEVPRSSRQKELYITNRATTLVNNHISLPLLRVLYPITWPRHSGSFPLTIFWKLANILFYYYYTTKYLPPWPVVLYRLPLIHPCGSLPCQCRFKQLSPNICSLNHHIAPIISIGPSIYPCPRWSSTSCGQRICSALPSYKHYQILWYGKYFSSCLRRSMGWLSNIR